MQHISRLYILFAACFCLAGTAFSQKNEIGIHGGVSYYHGELNPITPFEDPFAGLGIFYRRNFNHHFSVRANVLGTRLWNFDRNGRNDYQIQRNQQFRTLLVEGAVLGEVNFYGYEPGSTKKGANRFTPYLFAGIGAFWFNPQNLYQGQWIDVHDLNTEGQGSIEGRKPYKRVQPVIPFGIGIKATPFKGVILTIDWGMRLTFTDYLDDISTRYADPALLAATGDKPAVEVADQSLGSSVSNTDRQRGFALTKDWYGYLGLHLSIRIKDKNPDCWRGIKSRSTFRQNKR